MTKTDAWRRLAVETPAGTTLLFDPTPGPGPAVLGINPWSASHSASAGAMLEVEDPQL